MIYCSKCGAPNDEGASFCSKCGSRLAKESEDNFYNQQDKQDYATQRRKEDRWLITLLLCVFLGGLGIHRFYTDKIGTGVLMLLTGGGFLIWWLVDLIMIACNTYRDANGNTLK